MHFNLKQVKMKLVEVSKMFKPYAILCGAVSDALDALPAIPENVRARWLLEHALHQAEELYCETEENAPEAQTT